MPRSRPRSNSALQPKGLPNRFRAEGMIDFAQIFVPDDLVDRAAEAAGRPSLSGRLRSDLHFPDQPALENAIATYVRRAFDERLPPTALEMEARALLLLDEIVRLHDPTPPKIHSGGLASWQANRVTDYIEAHLCDELRLGELASIVDLSAKHFARAFRQTMGMPPHRWLTEARVIAAKERLASTSDSLAEIALACGFADQSHFTATVRRIVGVTPGRYREQVRG